MENKKQQISEEILRIHEISYGVNNLNEGFIDKLLSKIGLGKKTQDPKKADLVEPDVQEFFDNLENAEKSGGVSQQEKGTMTYQKDVESVQIGLMLLGYDLPVHGVDGLFGPETAAAVRNFKTDNSVVNENEEKLSLSIIFEDTQMELATPDMIKKMIELLKQKHITSDDLKKYVNVEPSVAISGLTDSNVYEKILELLGAPVTEENLKFLYAWRQVEGGGGKYNPFNTTLKYGNSTPLKNNSAGVQNYSSLQDGIMATVKTMKEPRYECIVNGLKKDIGANKIVQCQSLKTWGGSSTYTNLFANVLSGYESGHSPKIRPIA